MRRKHVPLRSCIACGQKVPKGELVRIVRTPEGRVEVDPLGKKSGRGSYLCRSDGCWEKGLKRDRLAYSLRGSISPEDKERLLAYYHSLPAAVTGGVS